MATSSRKFFIGAAMFSWFISSAAFHLNGDAYWATLITVKFLVFTFLGMAVIALAMGIAWHKLFIFLASRKKLQVANPESIHNMKKFRELLKLACLMSVFAVAHFSYDFFYSLKF